MENRYVVPIAGTTSNRGAESCGGEEAGSCLIGGGEAGSPRQLRGGGEEPDSRRSPAGG